MKTISLLFFLSLSVLVAQAQDVILKTDQTEVSAKVTEITTDEVKFKYFNRLDGPTYTLKKSDVSVITYQDGTRERFTATRSPVSQSTAPPSAYSRPANPPVVASPTVSAQKTTGWAYGLGYTTFGTRLGAMHGVTANAGFYVLAKSRTFGGLLDADEAYFFDTGFTRFGLVALNGVVRFSPTSRFYIGSGLGYGSVSVEVPTYDRLGKKISSTRVGSGDLGGKSFMGYGPVRLSLVYPSFKNAGSSLIMIGFYANPFH